MPADRPTQNGDPPRPLPFQFSLRSLLVLTTLTAVFLSCLFGGPLWLATFACLLVIFAAPVTLITIIVYGTGYRRTFAIGALTFVGSLTISPAGIPYYLYIIFDGDDGVAFRCYVLIGLLVGILIAAAFGLLAVMVRRMVEPAPSTTKNRPEEPASDDPQRPFA